MFKLVNGAKYTHGHASVLCSSGGGTTCEAHLLVDTVQTSISTEFTQDCCAYLLGSKLYTAIVSH